MNFIIKYLFIKFKNRNLNQITEKKIILDSLLI